MALRIIDGRVPNERLIDDNIQNAKLDSLFQGENAVLVPTGNTAYDIVYPTAFADIPIVVACADAGLQWVRVNDVTSTQFTWVANAGTGGSANWFAHGHKS